MSHGNVRVDGQRVDRPSFSVKPGMTVTLSERGREIVDVVAAVERGPQVKLPGYLALDPDDRFTGRVLARPQRHDVPFVVDESAIVEHYAR